MTNDGKDATTDKDRLIARLTQESKGKGDLITAQMAVNSDLRERIAELESVAAGHKADLEELAKLRILLELEPLP